MTTKIRELSVQEREILIEGIARPSYKFIQKRIKKQLEALDQYENVTLGELSTCVLLSLASISANMLKHLSAIQAHFAEDDPSTKSLNEIYLKFLRDQLKSGMN